MPSVCPGGPSRETTGYEVKDLADTLHRAGAAGARVLWGPYTAGRRPEAMMRFPGGYVAELHEIITTFLTSG
ncbi:hypothetical protein [Streptomyces sp. NPDC088760]|uniref:hypothetical protein n=1 Tax=Streptomyces sp. NPDC088760 TaxID=3365890 RepID=UPI00382ACDD3